MFHHIYLHCRLTYLNNGRILWQGMLSFRRFTDSDVFDVTSSKNNVLIDLFPWRSRSVCGPVFGTKGSHFSIGEIAVSSALSLQRYTS